MGRIIAKRIRGMSWMAKVSLILIFAMVFSTFMYQGWYKPKKTEAAITALQGWSNVYSSTAVPASAITYDIPAATYPGTRMLVVGVSSAIGTASTAQTCTVSYGGQSLTAVASNFTTSSRFHTALYYLLDAGIQAATNNQLTVTLSVQGTQWTAQVDAAVFEGVTQAAPASNQSWLNNGTASATVGPFGTALTIGTGELAIEAVAITRTSSTAPRTIGTWAANWSGAIGPTTVGLATTGSTNFYMAQDSTAGTTTSQHTATNTTNGSMSAMSLGMLAMNLTVGNGQTLGTLYAGQGTINNVLDSFTMVASTGGVSVNTLTLTGSANFITANIANVSVYRDNGTLGAFDSADVLVPSSYSAITGGVTTITFTTPEVVLTTTENFLVLVDIATGSATSGTFTGTITAATGSIGTPTYSDSASATQTLTASPGLTIGNGTDPVSDIAGLGSRENELDAFSLAVANANRGSAALDSVTFTGNANFTTANISGVKVYRSDGTLVPSTYSTITSNATTITFTQHEMVTSTTPQNYIVKVDIASGATVNQTVTGNISAAAGHGLGTPTDNDSASATLTIKQYAYKSTSCYQCHGYTSLFPDGTTRNTPAGQFIGDHNAHVVKAGYVCSTCHVIPATETSAGYGHRNGNIEMKASISGGTYARGTSFPQVNNSSSTTTCSNISCHGGNNPTPQWGVGAAACVTCHNGVITRTKGVPGGNLDNVVAEFNKTYGHKKTGRAAVSDADCIVCHLEGNYQTQKTSVYHADGNIDLRDPDNITNGESPITNISGGAFTFQKFAVSYAAGSRTTTGHTSNTDVANVITQKFCLGCHDSAGAANTTARSNNGGTGTNANPFGGVQLGAAYTATNGAIGTQGLIDVKTQTLATNSSFHPLQGPRNSAYPLPSRLASPYNNIGTGRDSNTSTSGSPRTLSNSVVMNCFDCHTTGTSLTDRTISAHGNNSAMIRGTVFVTSPTLCGACHVGYLTAPGTTSTHGAGSAMASSTGQTTTMATVCHNCHFSNQADPGRPIRAYDIHGFNGLLATGNAWTYGAASGMRPRTFIRNTGWATTSPRPYTAPGLTTTGAQCGGSATIGTCSNNSHTGYTPGGAY